MSDIMIAVDLSPFSEEVIRQGVTLAQRMNASVTLFSVVEVGLGIALAETVADLPARIRETEESLAAFKNQHPGTDINVVVATGNPKVVTLEVAHERNAAYLVVGTQGRTGLDHMLLGSTAESIIRHARIPVLVIPYNKADH
ncbi:nucleotide-binding universal stress UspA family protein [Chitinophaga dinghuensis]|uniref:Nucleotide-binding universal stress UspA family protein n=1 Tax=Chitinophaga dinghuensis TaxID=1539050 RepID=A0A327W9E9_9BACT|nr:universal stress protein [Chitinophaga dinghuensis]RAJ87337.1 nucleotide-binding universal stress UspA family protein [Chitinophaga dinghuensis]